MDRFILSDDLLTGMDDVDAQHRLLFELANQVVDPTSERGANAAFFASLAFLAEYVRYHFAAEEFAMKRAHYPEAERHCLAHVEFRALIGEFLEASLEEPSIADLRLRLTEAVEGWLTTHIRVADKALAGYLRLCASDGPATLPGTPTLIAAGFFDNGIDFTEIEAPSASQHGT